MALREVPGHRHTPADLPPRKRPGITYTGGWEDIRAFLDGSGKSRPIGGSTLRNIQPTVSRYTDCTTLAAIAL